MLKFTAEHFRGIRHAEIIAAPLALICGPNEQGKSSIIDGVRACLDGNVKPYGLTKEEIEEKLLHNDTVGAFVDIAGDDRGMTIKWPSGEVSTEGKSFRSTQHATGSLRFAEMPDRDRMTTLTQYLKTEPDKTELTEAIAHLKLDKEVVDALWLDIQKQGMDGAYQKHMQEGTKLKGAWEQITKARYGSKVGKVWRPDGWTDDHEAIVDAELQQELEAAEKALEGAIGKVAINADERARLEALTKNIPKLKEMLTTRAADFDRAQANLVKAEQTIQKIPVLPKDKWPACPHCQKSIQVMAGDVLRIPPAAISDDERKDIENQLENAQRVFDEAKTLRDEAQNKRDVVAVDLAAAERAKASVESSDPQAITPAALEELRDEVTRCKSIQAVKVRIRDALKAHMAVIAKADIVNVLAPEGLRKTKLAARLAAFNEDLAKLCEIAGWDAVTMTPDAKLELAARPYILCAASGRYRCDATLQVAFAKIDGSEILLMDDAEKLDGDGRNGLFALLQHTGRFALVGMMLIRAKEAPDLAKAGIGHTFWIQGAEAHELGKKLAA